ncbi:hypothetical protein ACTD5D_21385 [Nocardia takedensis]|uniref:hypothetical protein n=1 Tax=Nocardia takedensis TaxID=259390 RepID=UPI003F7604C5
MRHIDAPTPITQFFGDLATRWNTPIDRIGAHLGPNQPVPPELAPGLARELFECERHTQQGLGTAHSLIATLVVDPA